jgi:hypothetical protein
MNIVLWLLLYISSSAFAWWIVWAGGAAWFEGWRALAIVDWLFAYRWSADQIAMYILICWVGHTIWFIVGLFMPETRGVYW